MAIIVEYFVEYFTSHCMLKTQIRAILAKAKQKENPVNSRNLENTGFSHVS